MNKKMILIAVALLVVVCVLVVVIVDKSSDKKEDITVTFTDGLSSEDSGTSDTESEDTEEDSVEKEEEVVFPKDKNGNDIDVTGYIDESTYMEYDDTENDDSVTGGVSSEDYESLQNMTDEQRKLSDEIFESGEGAAPY